MLEIDIPGFGDLQLKHLVCDFSGTLSVDGILIDGVADRLNALAETIDIHVLTADTHGGAETALANVKCNLILLEPKYQDMQKEQYLLDLDIFYTVAIGNGQNDRLMLRTARLGIAVCLAEGFASEAARAANVITSSITDALDLLLKPNRLIATLRS